MTAVPRGKSPRGAEKNENTGEVLMKKNNWVFRLFALMMVGVAACSLTALAVPSSGSESDPLISLSYLYDVFLPGMMDSVGNRIDARDELLRAELNEKVSADIAALEEKYGAAASAGASAGTVDEFVVVTLTNGQTLGGGIGCEVMLRVGSAVCTAPGSPGLIDETDASTLESGRALVKNHLYMMTIENRGVKATAETTKLLVRGTYSIS